MPESNNTALDRLLSTLPPKEKKANLTPVGPLLLAPISFSDACAFISLHHRHHQPPRGWKFGVSCLCDSILCGVAICGRPVNRHLASVPTTLEITRLCTDGTPHAASKLYSACWRAARALGYLRLITYTLITEPGPSLRAAGFRIHSYTNGHTWDSPTRPRRSSAPTVDKILWELTCPPT